MAQGGYHDAWPPLGTPSCALDAPDGTLLVASSQPRGGGGWDLPLWLPDGFLLFTSRGSRYYRNVCEALAPALDCGRRTNRGCLAPSWSRQPRGGFVVGFCRCGCPIASCSSPGVSNGITHRYAKRWRRPCTVAAERVPKENLWWHPVGSASVWRGWLESIAVAARPLPALHQV